MGRLWSDQRRYDAWLAVETAAAEVMAEAGLIPADAARAIREHGAFDIARIEEIEATTHHDVIAFTTAVAEKVGPSARWLHFGLTSSDVVDTALALQMRDACDLIVRGLDELAAAVKQRAEEHRHTAMIGRTHGVHAEPMTFGLKVALWYTEIQRNLERVRRVRSVVAVGKISGRRRHLCALGALDRGGGVPAARSRARAGLLAGHPARSACGSDDHAGHLCGVAREVRARDPRVAEDRDWRGGGAVCQGAEGLVRDAAQAESHRLRADLWTRAAGARQCRGGARERGALARARHLALVRRARHSARLVHRARSHASAIHAHREGHGRVSGSDARESGPVARRGVLGTDPAGSRLTRHLTRTGVLVGPAKRHAILRRAASLQGPSAGGRGGHGRPLTRRRREGLRPSRAAAACGRNHR